MPFAVAHFLAAAAVMKLTGLRLDRSKLLSARELFLCAFLGVLPDIDMLIQLIAAHVLKLNFYPHRLFTHNIIIPIVLLVIGLLLYRKDVNRYASTIFFLASIAWGVHVLLDLAFMGPIRLWVPFSWANIPSLLSWTTAGIKNLFIAVDAILLVGWLFLRMIRNGRHRQAMHSM